MNQSANSPVIGIDFGTQRIGVASASTPLAEPERIFSGKERGWREVANFIVDQGATEVVLGLSENEMAIKTRQFGDWLAKTTGANIHYIDETLSSQDMRGRLKQSKAVNAVKASGHIDHYVAAALLQEWLDEQ